MTGQALLFSQRRVADDVNEEIPRSFGLPVSSSFAKCIERDERERERASEIKAQRIRKNEMNRQGDDRFL